MSTRHLLGFAGAAVVAAIATLFLSPQGTTSPEAAARGIAASPDAAPLAQKGDRLSIAVGNCPGCEPLAQSALPVARWITVERRIGDATSVLIRIPVHELTVAQRVASVFEAVGPEASAAPNASPER